MNNETVLMCAQMTARQQLAALGYVGADVQALLDELTPAPEAEVEEAAPAAEEPAAEEPAAEAEVQQVAPEEQAVVADEQPAQ